MIETGEYWDELRRLNPPIPCPKCHESHCYFYRGTPERICSVCGHRWEGPELIQPVNPRIYWEDHSGMTSRQCENEKCEARYYDMPCGTATATGSAVAEHMMSCMGGCNPYKSGGLFKPNDGVNYPSWEAPAGNCPFCWHKQNPEKEATELSRKGADMRNALFGQ